MCAVQFSRTIRTRCTPLPPAYSHARAFTCSQSIDIHPTAATYSNRAMVYIKLQKFTMAEADCDKVPLAPSPPPRTRSRCRHGLQVLQLEPQNVKALLRRGIARQVW